MPKADSTLFPAFCAALTLSLAACVPAVDETPLPADPSTDACGASGLQDLVGQPRSVLQAMRFSAPTRIIEPGMAVTMDYVAERLNVWIADGGFIEQVTCG